MYNEYSHTSPIHTFIHPWHQYFHMYIHNIFIHNINSYTFALVVQNIVFNRVLPVRVSLIIVSSRKLQQMNVLHLSFILFQATSPTQWTAWVYLLSCFQATSPTQWTTWVYLLSCFQATSPKQWTAWVFLPFILFQATSPKQWTAWIYLFSCFKLPVLNNGPLEFIFYLVSSYQS